MHDRKDTSLYSSIAVYQIKYTDKNKYESFKKMLNHELADINLTNKIKFDDSIKQVSIFYYPRIFKAMIDYEQMMNMSKYIDYDEEQIFGNLAYNPYQILNQFLTPEYKQRNETQFKQLAKKWDEEIKSIETYSTKSKSDQKNEKKDCLPPDWSLNLINSPVFGIGENHDHLNSCEFILNNLALLAKQGFKTIFLEGIPQEVQPLLDQFLSACKEEMSKELKCILTYNDGNHKKLKIILEAKKLKIRVVGLDNQFTYLADESHGIQIDLRIKSFNYVAYEIINKNEGHEKYFFLCGSDHLKYSTSASGDDFVIPGIASRLSCLSIVIYDNYDQDKFGKLSLIPGSLLTSRKQAQDYMATNIATKLYEPVACDFFIDAPQSCQALTINLSVLQKQQTVISRLEFEKKASVEQNLMLNDVTKSTVVGTQNNFFKENIYNYFIEILKYIAFQCAALFIPFGLFMQSYFPEESGNKNKPH